MAFFPPKLSRCNLIKVSLSFSHWCLNYVHVKKKRRVINTKSKAIRKFISTANTLKWLFCRPEASNLDLVKANEYIKGAYKDVKCHSQVKEAKFLITATNQVKIPTWTEVIGNEILVKFNVKFTVNFSHDIFNVIAEGHQFEYLDYKMKPVIRMAIMRKDTLYLDLIAVRGIIRRYNEIIEKLSIAEVRYPQTNFIFLLKILSIISPRDILLFSTISFLNSSLLRFFSACANGEVFPW